MRLINILNKMEDNNPILYSPVYGKVILLETNISNDIISILTRDNRIVDLNGEGKLYPFKDAECILFPNKRKKTWANFVPYTLEQLNNDIYIKFLP